MMKIDSVDNEPVLKKHVSKKEPNMSSSESNIKRLQSLNNFKRNYQAKKNLIQSALSNIDNNPKNKIIFDDGIADVSEDPKSKKKTKKSLFDDDHSEGEEFNVDFEVKEQFQGKEGQKLLSLQSKYKNDKRFILDSRFVDEQQKEEDFREDENENSLEIEKKKEYEILEQVLGKTVSKLNHQNDQESQKKVMLRFDPSVPEHSKFELQNETENVKKKKRKKIEPDVQDTKRTEDKDVPVVSKETFYKVGEKLKESLHEKQEFSLLSMFGRTDETKPEEHTTEEMSTLPVPNNFLKDSNPFKYDSSDDEDETERILNKDSTEDMSLHKNQDELRENRKTSWTESFFFKNDDYRLQEGFDFIERMRTEEKTEFSKLRRDLKEIVKAKVRNNQRKHKMFKKKLGGSKRKKMLRMKRALKR